MIGTQYGSHDAQAKPFVIIHSSFVSRPHPLSRVGKRVSYSLLLAGEGPGLGLPLLAGGIGN